MQKNSFRGPRISRTFIKIHSADLRFTGFLLNSFRGSRISRTVSQSAGGINSSQESNNTKIAETSVLHAKSELVQLKSLNTELINMINNKNSEQSENLKN